MLKAALMHYTSSKVGDTQNTDDLQVGQSASLQQVVLWSVPLVCQHNKLAPHTVVHQSLSARNQQHTLTQ